jgi:integrase
VKNYEFIFNQFQTEFGDRPVDTFTPDEILSFIIKLTDGTKQTTKHNRYSSLKVFFNFIINSIDPNIKNPCDTPILRKISKDRKSLPWPTIEKELIDEIIFKTVIPRNRIMLELMARGGMRGGEVLKIRPIDIQDPKITLSDPKSGKESEMVFIPQKVADRLKEYLKEKGIEPDNRIFPITYNAARVMVNKAGKLVRIHLRPHDLRRFCATYASRAGTPIEIVSKIILRHSHLSTTQRYLGKICDIEALKWIENLYG